MGAVYQAWDAALGVAVALKVIRPEANDEDGAGRQLERRFKQELLLARKVTHKNVVRIHDLGEINGITYITMPYIEGMDLATTLRKTGAMAVGDCLRIARDIAAGLKAAHDAGVVHRDLKPANIMIDGDQAVIMDFGIARSTAPAGAQGVPRSKASPGAAARFAKPYALMGSTMAGAVIGTLDFMAPEQARGEAVDQRADIYAFGLIVYDMLVPGRNHTAPRSALDDLAKRMEQAPPSPRTIDPQIPEAVDEIVARCLRPDAGDRYQTTTDLAAALDRLDLDGRPIPEVRPLTRRKILAAAAVMIALLAGTWWSARPRPAPVQPPPTSVLIANFVNGAHDPVFEESLEQALTIALEGAPFLTAYSRTTAQRLAPKLKPGAALDEQMAQLIALREGVKIVLAGAVEPAGSGYIVTVRAIDPANGKQLASATAKAANKAKVLEAVGSVAAQMRTGLGDRTPEAAKRAAAETFTSASLEAVQAYARGQDLNKAGKPRDALQAFDRAVALDPEFGRAYANMALIYTNLKQEDKAKSSYEKALQKVDRMTEREKYRTLGVYYLGLVRNYEKAIENYRALVTAYPADNMGYSNLALAYLYKGDIPQARTFSRQALDIYPKNLLQRTNYATYSMYAGDFQTAIAEAARVLQENPSYEFAHLTQALSSIATGDVDAGRAAYGRLAATGPLGASLANMGEADLDMAYGRYGRAARILGAGIERDRKESTSSSLGLQQIAAAETSLALGRVQEAVRLAREAIRSSSHESVLFPGARVLVAADHQDEAMAIAATLDNMLQTQTRSYARLIRGVVALHGKRYADAIELIRDGQRLHDSWLAHALLAEVYTAAGRFGEALADWELCVKRRGEVADVFFADTSSLHYLPPVYYWFGRSQQALGAADGARASYQEFLRWRSEADPPDPLAADAQSRLKAR
jgi:tetratricopeptide (TPR) repeat protein